MAFGMLLFATVALQGSATNDFRDANLNLAFSYPSRWKITKKDKREVHFEIPFANSSRAGELVVIRTGFRGLAEDWQNLQKQTNELSNRTVVRQWSQDLLGAPLLLTQVNYIDKTDSMTMTTGLFYTNVPSKMLFHLKVPASVQDEMAFEWQQTLETFRTLDGNPLASEDPSKPSVARPPVVATESKRPLTVDKEKVSKVPANRLIRVEINGRKLEIELPEAWGFTDQKDSQVTLVNKAKKVSFGAEILLRIDSEPADAWLARFAGTDLAAYATIALREDAENVPTRFGTTYGYTIRSGKGNIGYRWSGGGYVNGADAYLKGTFTGTDATLFPEQKKAVEALFAALKVRTLP